MYTRSRKDLKLLAEVIFRMTGGSHWNHLELGSKTYGHTYKIAYRDPETGGLSRVVHLGMTASEAHHFLSGVREGLFAAEGSTVL